MVRSGKRSIAAATPRALSVSRRLRSVVRRVPPVPKRKHAHRFVDGPVEGHLCDAGFLRREVIEFDFLASTLRRSSFDVSTEPRKRRSTGTKPDAGVAD